VTALEAGADDVLQRDGLSLRELSLRLRAVGRRRGVAPEEPVRFELGALVIDWVHHTVALDGRPIAMAPAELRVLTVLAASLGRVVDRETLILRAWGEEAPSTRTVDSVVKRLRARLGPAGGLIETVRGVGYRLARAGRAGRPPARGQDG
jgi:two-component system, OmpR family, phosphate regulon response regulator PhoB